MKTLQIPHVKQINNLSCGAACLEMVYKFFGLDVSQNDIFEKYKTSDPHNIDGARILTKDLVNDAKSREFASGIIAVDFLDVKSTSALLKLFLDNDIPVVVCQQYSLNDPLVGHFRVVIGIDDENICLHDPGNPLGNGDFLRLSLLDFFKLWQPTGENVTGGRLVWFMKV